MDKILKLSAFILTAYSAYSMKWSLQEYCWILWMTGLVYTWVCISTAMIQIVLTVRKDQKLYLPNLPFAGWMDPGKFVILLSITAVLAGGIAFIIYNFLLGFYGIFLSFFAEMYPYRFFGRDGFINTNFFTPAIWLIVVFWPMPVANLLARYKDFFGPKPWRRLVFPLQKEIIRMHLLILIMPVITMLCFIFFRNYYSDIVIIILTAVFYFFPEWKRKQPVPAPSAADPVIPEERPADWKFTTDDLFKELESKKRSTIYQREIDWAKDYERSLMPSSYRYPKEGDIYESAEDQIISYLTAWSAPYTGDGSAMLFKGERILINTESRDEKPVVAYAIPVEYEKLHVRMVPEKVRTSPKYGGFYFCFSTKDLNEKFRLISG